MCDGLHQMRFSESHAAVDKERVIDASGIFGNRKGSGMREIIVFTDDKGIEGIARIQFYRGKRSQTYRRYMRLIRNGRFAFSAVKHKCAGNSGNLIDGGLDDLCVMRRHEGLEAGIRGTVFFSRDFNVKESPSVFVKRQMVGLQRSNPHLIG